MLTTRSPEPQLDEVALRMTRIKASAAAIREAIEAEAQRAAMGGPATAAPMIPAPATMTEEPRPAANDVGFDDSELDAELEEVLAGRATSVPDDFDLPPVPRRANPAAASALDRDFLGGDDDFDEGDEYADGAMDGGAAVFAPAARPIPWRPILIGAAVMVAIGGWVFRAQLFPSTPAVDDTNLAAEVRGGSVAPDEKKPEAKAVAPKPAAEPTAPATPAPEVPGGKPVTPELATPAPTVAGVSTPPSTPAPIPAAPGPGTAAPTAPVPGVATRPAPDAETSARLDEARSLYVAAKGGSQRKKLAEARTLLQEILITAPAQADALLLLSQIELELGHADAALATAIQCTQAAAEIADCWLTIGVLQQDRRKKADATAAYEKYLALAPDGRYAGDVRSQLKRLKK